MGLMKQVLNSRTPSIYKHIANNCGYNHLRDGCVILCQMLLHILVNSHNNKHNSKKILKRLLIKIKEHKFCKKNFRMSHPFIYFQTFYLTNNKALAIFQALFCMLYKFQLMKNVRKKKRKIVS